MTENFDAGNVPNRSGCEGQPNDYLSSAAAACEAGDLQLGMHLYLAAYEHAAADPSIPDGMALTGLREAWNLACNLKERSIAEYVFEKLEPYLTGPEIAACANQLQSLALDRLEEYGFSREELEDMAEMIAQDFGGGEASVVKVESISIPNMGMFGVPPIPVDAVVEGGAEDGLQAEGPSAEAPSAEPAGNEMGDAREESASALGAEPQDGPGPARAGKPSNVDMSTADAGFNPYEEYDTSSVGKSYHAATNEGAGSFVFTRDKDRAEAGRIAREEAAQGSADAASGHGAPDAQKPAQPDEPPAQPPATAAASEGSVPPPGQSIRKRPASPAVSAAMPSMPAMPPVQPEALSYGNLAGYDEAVSVMRELGVGLQGDPAFEGLVAELNQRHGFSRPPALDTVLLRAPVVEDATRFVEATIGEIGLPVLRVSMEEGPQGMPVLCVTTYGNNRPRMNHQRNRFEAPAILVIDDLDTWSMPEIPENVEGIGGFVMANISRGAREAVNFIRASVEDPDVFVLATASTMGDPDPFFYELLEPMTIVDIGYPTEKERADIWNEIARNHPSMSDLPVDALVKFSASLPRYDIYLAAREALEDSYKQALAQRSFVPVSMQGMLEKLAACQPLESDEYRNLEDEVVREFSAGLDRLEDLLAENGE